LADVPEVERACALANDGAITFAEAGPEARAVFLETIADHIDAIGDELIERAIAETLSSAEWQMRVLGPVMGPATDPAYRDYLARSLLLRTSATHQW
jgi:hypothetical protein